MPMLPYPGSTPTTQPNLITTNFKRLDPWLLLIWVNERQIQTTEEKIDTSNASSVIIERQQHTEQPESNNEGEVDQNADQCYDTRPLPTKLTNNTTTELSNQLLESENVCLKKTVAQFQKDFAKLDAHYISENRASRNFDLMMDKWRLLKITLQAPKFKTTSNETVKFKAGSKSCSSSSQSQSTSETLVGITISPSCSNAEDNQVTNRSYDSKPANWGFPRISKVRIASLGIKELKEMLDKWSKQRSLTDNLRQKSGSIHIACQNHKLIADIDNDIWT
ncbi:hypothetical protein Tco_1018852 [Tanacetum coccineum]|uniref:Uncharacterized protein n=1 Tax=Tanacetum coccineum TaxID=301880 RepID=A0ABQ5FXZ0_9ASTR